MADKFVKMTKDSKTIEVNPLVVEDHKRLGWKEVPTAPVAAETPAAASGESVKPETAKERKAREKAEREAAAAANDEAEASDPVEEEEK